MLFFILLFFAGLIYLSQTDFLKQQNSLEPSELLDSISKHTITGENTVSISPASLQSVAQSGGWLQILGSDGKEIYRYHTPKNIQTAYAPGELLAYRESPSSFGYKIYTWYPVINTQKLTWVYATPYSGQNVYNLMNDYRTWIVISVLSLVITLIIAYIFGLRMGIPILHMLSWIDNLSKGVYREPVNKKGVRVSRKDSYGTLRRSYKTFKEIIVSIEVLSRSLMENDEKKRQMDNAREEWIAGVSHDMKTPLSSVKGYADLLSHEKFDFSKEQTAQYAGIISEKAAYMKDLIEDLNLTLRLNNHALPIKLESRNIVELVRRSVIDLINSGLSDGINFELINSEEENIIYPVDDKWFKRAIDNLLANAAVHNKEGTTVKVQVKQIMDSCIFQAVELIIQDDGKGMDKQTLEHLFDRYFRGTSTKDSEVKSSGLGTAIAKQLIEAHKGTISVKSEPQNGTEFVIRLPSKN
ncbi:MAG: ATP-binding protein [Clostridium sp.]|uniref:sensor histidine kinase n=1 Tax=Clostridium sp. TaxID=1506 RepID=UPI003D6CE4D1